MQSVHDEPNAIASDHNNYSNDIDNSRPPDVLPDPQTARDPVASDYGGASATSPQLQKTRFSVPQLSWARIGRLSQSSLDYLQDSWFLEVSACVLVILLLGAEIGILAAYNDRPIDSWPWAWPLNSAVALFTTLIESLLLFATASCIGQMKWLWFVSDEVEKQRLIWIDFLARSNTPVGALSLLCLHPTT